jgi:hypothetical protein
MVDSSGNPLVDVVGVTVPDVVGVVVVVVVVPPLVVVFFFFSRPGRDCIPLLSALNAVVVLSGEITVATTSAEPAQTTNFDPQIVLAIYSSRPRVFRPLGWRVHS